ncbi:MAG: CvpA family protein [Candidatus Goldbacteria bacterium]|nr:CvpA family protein [Candidatus Goldiibacteriota bacterium]
MNYIDIILCIVIFFGFLAGWKTRGMIVMMVPFALLAGIITANLGYKPFSEMLNFVSDPEKRLLLSYTLLFLTASTAVVFFFMALVKAFDFFALSFVDRALGAALIISFALLISMYSFSLLEDKMEKESGFHQTLSESKVYTLSSKYLGFAKKVNVEKQLAILKSLIN